jgi:hypothetical protein
MIVRVDPEEQIVDENPKCSVASGRRSGASHGHGGTLLFHQHSLDFADPLITDH